MLKTFALRQRERLLTVHGPRGLARLFKLLDPVIGRVPFPLELVELSRTTSWNGRGIGSPLSAWTTEGRRSATPSSRIRGRVSSTRIARASSASTWARLRPAPERGGRERRPAGPGHGRAAARPQDRPHGRHRPVRHDAAGRVEADLLVHEAAFIEKRPSAPPTRHSTAAQAAELAAEAGVETLALTHISPRCAGGEVRDEARAAFRQRDRAARLRRVEIPSRARRARARQGVGPPARARAGCP